QEAPSVEVARVDQTERDATPDLRVGGEAHVGALREARAHVAEAVLHMDGPDAAAVAGKPELEGEVDARRALRVHHEWQRLDHRLRGRAVELGRIDVEIAQPVADPPAPDRG